MGSIGKRQVTDADIAQLRKLLSGTDAEVHSPSDKGYARSVERWSKAAEKNAGVAVVPTNSEQVSVAVKYASEYGLQLAVKGGGHSTSGASSTQGGLLIDLGRMRAVEVDVEKKQLQIQGGALWKDSDEAAWKHGLATVGGTVADTGVGGLTLGGGYGHLSGEYGLVIDNTVSFTVVLANGNIETVSKESNPDLFWAMNGAGQNFGVTTEFVLQAHPQGQMYMGSLIFDTRPETIGKLVAAVNEIWETQPSPAGRQTKVKGRAGALLGMARPPNAGGRTVVLVNLVFNGPEAEAKEVLKPIFDVGPVANQMRMGDYPLANALVPSMYGMRSSMKGSSFVMPIRKEFFVDVMAEYDRFLDSCEDAARSLIAYELYDPCKVAELDNGSFANRGYHLNSLIMPLWTRAENDERCREFAREVSIMFKHEIEKHGHHASSSVEGGVGIRGKKGAVMLYGNYDQYEEKSKDVFGDHYERLQALKAEYDPNNLFDKLFPITPQSNRSRI